MFGLNLPDLEKLHQEMDARLAATKFTETVEDGAVSVTVNGKGRIEAINLGEAVKGWDLEQLEDMLTVAINRAIEKTEDLKTEESAKSIQNIIPPGLSGMFGR